MEDSAAWQDHTGTPPVGIIGRRREQAALATACSEFRAGAASVVLVTGERGSGKTALVDWLVARAMNDGYPLLRGRCTEPYSAGAAFTGSRHGTGGQTSPLRAESLDALLAMTPEQERTPRVVIVEDVQWADSATLSHLEATLRDLDRQRLLLVITASVDAPQIPGPLAGVLATAQRECRCTQIDLHPLTEADIAEMLAARGLAGTSHNLARQVHRRSDGNAFFATALVAQLTTDSDGALSTGPPQAVPPGITETVIQRLSPVSTPAMEVARAAAVLGRAFDVAELQAVPGLAIEAVDAALDELEAAGILAAEGSERFRFVHGLVQEVLYATLPTRRRFRLHESAANFLLAANTGNPAHASLARHFEQMGDSPKALGHWRAAASACESRRDWHGAIECLERCVALLPGEGRAATKERATLLLALGRSYRNENEVRHAWRLLMEAIALYRELADGPGMAQVILEALRIPAPPERREELVRHALAAIEGNPDPEIEAQLLLQQTVWTAVPADADASQRAAALAAEHGPDIRPLLTHSEGSAALRDGRPEEARRLFLQLHEASAAQGRTGWALQLLASANTIPLFAGDLLKGVAATKRAIAAAEKAGSAIHAAGLMMWLAGTAFAVGDEATAAALLARAERVNPLHFGVAWLRAVQAEVAGRVDEAVALMPTTGGLGGQPGWLATVHGARARTLHLAGDDEAARHELARWEYYWRIVGGQPAAPTASFLNTMAAVDSVLPALGEPGIVEEVYAELQRWSWARFAPANGCALDQLRGSLALRLGRPAEAESHFRAGDAWALREGCPVEQGRCILGLAEIADANGSQAQSEQLLKDAGRRFRKAGAELYLRDVEALLAPAPEMEAGHHGEASPIGTLSPREIEVLNLIAAGYTNAQIADELHISTNTVARHVTHILVKTGGANRAEATSYAYRHELIAPARNGGQARE